MAKFLALTAIPLLCASALSAQAEMPMLHSTPRPPLPVYSMEPSDFEPGYSGPERPMRPLEVAQMLHHLGFRDLGRLELNGETYRLIATDRAGAPVTLLLDAYDGDILDIRPLGHGSRGALVQRPSAKAKIVQIPRAEPRPVARPMAQPPARPHVTAAAPSPRATAPRVTVVQKSAPTAPSASSSYPPSEPDVLRKLATR